MRPRAAMALAFGVVLLLVTGGQAHAHDERETRTLDGSGSVPVYRSSGPALLVCTGDKPTFDSAIAAFPAELRATNEALWAQCQTSGYRNLQEAVDAVTTPGVTIKMLPGRYQELPSLAPPSSECAGLSGIGKSELYHYDILSLEQQRACPHNQNLVAVIGKQDLQIEGTGAKPTDVVVDAQFKKLNTIRADNADGIYFRNLTAERSQFNAFYILETDGFVVEKAVGRWNDEYGFLTFAVDHGLYTEAEGYGNGDSAFYPGAASNINKDRGYDVERYTVEIRNSYGHHNMLGYSGTAGDSVWVHDSVFTDNSTGISTDSAFPDHPGLPQNHSLFERNVIANNNTDYYRYFADGTCRKPYAERGYETGVVCPVVGVPVGVGAINPGGNYNVWRDNWIHGNSYGGFLTSWVPGFVRNDTSFAAQFDTSHHNRYLGNHMGVTKEGTPAPNGVDYWWDGQGVDSCWTTAPGSVDVSSNIGPLPACGADGLPTALGLRRYIGEPLATLKMYACGQYNLEQRKMPVDCDWWGAYAATGLERIEVKAALAEGVLLAVLLLLLWVRRLRGSAAAALGVVLAPLGWALAVAGAWQVDARLEAAGLALVGLGLVAVSLGLGRVGRRKLAGLTLLIGLLALLGAIDHGVRPIPFIPVSPALLRVLLELAWVTAVVVAVVRRRQAAAPEPAPELVSQPAT